MRKRKKQKPVNAPKKGIIRIPTRVLSDGEFSKLIDQIESGKIRPGNKEDLRRRSLLDKAGNSLGIAQRMRTLEEKMHRSEACIPTYLVDVQSDHCQVIYLSKEQSERLHELKNSIQRPVKPVKPIDTDQDKKNTTEDDEHK